MIKVILPAGSIPLGASVTKRTGSKVYVMRDKLCVYRQDRSTQEIKAGSDARFLVADNGDASAVGMTTELVWLVGEQDLIEYLEGPSQ